MTHALKTEPIYFRSIIEGIITFNVRKADRDFKVGDTLLLQEYDPNKEKYTGQEWSGLITFLMDDSTGYVKKGYVCFAIKEKDSI